MRRPFAVRSALIVGVVTAFVTALLLASSGSGKTLDPVIDTAAPIEPSQCVPCHMDLGSVNEPGLLFSHGNHLLYSCDACHSRMPHRDGVTERVPMEVCFACHGVQHGPQGELATGKCRQCHTTSVDLRPRSHAKDWAKRPHAEVANVRSVNECMMCHDAPKDCDACHQRTVPKVGKMPAEYHSLVTPRPKDPSIKIDPKGKASPSQCMYCHPDLDEITPGRIIFAHADHLRRNYRCEACHSTFAHRSQGQVAKPDMLSCYRCHGLQHSSRGQVATEECGRCHPKGFELTPSDHTASFIKGEHKKRSNADPAYCAMCHKSTFCVGCHRGEKVSPNAPGKAVIPASHTKAQWQAQHGADFLGAKGACGSCHTDPSCKRCHSTVMPHPVGWIDDHKPAPGISGADCNVCHQDRSSCQKCHHQEVARKQLVRENCVSCHDEMRNPKPTTIKNKGFAEHAVHFYVVESGAKAKPYTCDDCHIGFRTSRRGNGNGGSGGETQPGGVTEPLPEAGHDVRLCYTCHGNVNYLNQQEAPWPGAQLCVRCHSDINV